MPGESSSESGHPYGRMHVTEPVRATIPVQNGARLSWDPWIERFPPFLLPTRIWRERSARELWKWSSRSVDIRTSGFALVAGVVRTFAFAAKKVRTFAQCFLHSGARLVWLHGSRWHKTAALFRSEEHFLPALLLKLVVALVLRRRLAFACVENGFAYDWFCRHHGSYWRRFKQCWLSV